MKQDRDFNDTTWNNHLRQYKDRYRMFRDEQFIWSIKTKNGCIQPYSIIKKQVVAILTFKTGRQQTYFLRRLQYNARCTYEITQEGDDECCIMFNENDLNKMVYLLKIYKKKRLSEKNIEKLRQNLILARQTKNGEDH